MYVPELLAGAAEELALRDRYFHAGGGRPARKRRPCRAGSKDDGIVRRRDDRNLFRGQATVGQFAG
jgi:hypothetical protein